MNATEPAHWNKTACIICALNCGLGQGYLFSRPLEAPDLERFPSIVIAREALRLGASEWTVGLLLAKFSARAGEVGVRRALGATKSEIFHQYLIEAAVDAVLGEMMRAEEESGAKFRSSGPVASSRTAATTSTSFTTINASARACSG